MKKIRLQCVIDNCTAISEIAGKCGPHYRRDYYQTHKVPVLRQSKVYYVANHERQAAVKKAWHAAHKGQKRDFRDRQLYNLLPGERQKIWDFQKGLDPISGQPLTPLANMDHDHKTGLIRGLLNPMTNQFLVDNVKKLMAMLAYVQNPPAPAALGEQVYGLVGKAKHKKKMLYGPDRTPLPQLRGRR